MIERKINLAELSREELINLILSLQTQTSYSEIKLSNIYIKSNADLRTCERTLNRIIKVNKDFLNSESKKIKNFLVENDSE